MEAAAERIPEDSRAWERKAVKVPDRRGRFGRLTCDRDTLIMRLQSHNNNIGEGRMSNAETFREYLTRFTSGDVAGAGELLDEAFVFAGPMLLASSKAEFLAGSAPAAAMARGCTVHQQWENGEDVCSIYDFEVQTPAGSASIPMAEWSVIRDGRLVSSRLLFDTAAMASLMPAE